MPVGESLKIALMALLTNKFRSFLTMLGVIIGVSSVIMLVAVGSGIKTFVTGKLESLGSNLLIVAPGEINPRVPGGGSGGGIGAVASSKLRLEDVFLISEDTDAENVAGIFVGSDSVRYVGKQKAAQVVGATSSLPDTINIKLAKGRFFTKSEVQAGKRLVVLGANIEDKISQGIDLVGERVVIGNLRYLVVGIMQKQGGIGAMNLDNQVIAPITAVHRHFDTDKISFIYVNVGNTAKIDSVRLKVEQVLGRRLKEDEFTVIGQEEILSTASTILGTLTLGLSGIAAISLIVGGIGIMNIMLVSVAERTREIGLRKALGATPRAILIQFLIESIFLSVGGGVIGIVIGVSGSLVIGQFMTTTITWWAIVLSFGISVGVGLIFGVMPARRAARLSPIEALRYE